MAYNPYQSILKTLQIIEVFEYYDSPILYSAASNTGQLYLARMVATSKEKTIWHYVEISAERYGAVRSGAISVREAFLEPENGFVIECEVSVNGAIETLIMTPSMLQDSTLPDDSERLSARDTWLPAKNKTVQAAATSAKRQVIDVSLNMGGNGVSISAGRIGSFLINLQSVTEALACDQSQSVYRIPDTYKNRNQLYPTGLFQGSFGIRIVTSDESDLLATDEDHALFKLVKLLQDSEDLEKLSNDFRELNLLTRSRFIRFLRSLADNELSVNFDWASATGGSLKATMDLPRARTNLVYLEATKDASSETRAAKGILEAVGITKRTFEFQETNGPYIKGEIDKKLLSNLIKNEAYFRVPYPINAKLREQIKINAVTGAETLHHVLIDFHLPEE